MAGRRVVLALFLAGTGAIAIGAATLARTRQSHRERELVLAWRTMGWSLHRASDRLGLRGSIDPDTWELSSAPSDPAVRSRLDSLEGRVWREMARRQRERGIDSLREALRRDRERVALALAHCREGTRSVPSRWFLSGFPRR